MNRLSVALLSALALCSVTAADQGRTEIGPTDSFPIVIDTPGSYVLTADLHVTADAVNGIQIDSDNVDLDLGGHVVRGPGASATSGTGIYSEYHTGITLSNGVVTEFYDGVYVPGLGGTNPTNRFRDLTTTWCVDNGIRFYGGVARDIATHDNGTSEGGVGLLCQQCSVVNVVASGNYEGMHLVAGAAANCSVSRSQESGVNLFASTFNGGAVFDNGDSGVLAQSASVITGVSVYGNDGYGIVLYSGGHNNAVNCTARNNTLGSQFGCGDGNGCHQNYMP